MTINLPIKIGELAFIIGKSKRSVTCGEVTEMFFSPDMRLFVRIRNRYAAEWGVKAFRTRSEAEKALYGKETREQMPMQNAELTYNAMTEYIRSRIRRDGKKQKEIAEEIGCSTAAITELLGSGRMKYCYALLAMLEFCGMNTLDMFYTYIDKKEEETA